MADVVPNALAKTPTLGFFRMPRHHHQSRPPFRPSAHPAHFQRISSAFPAHFQRISSAFPAPVTVSFRQRHAPDSFPPGLVAAQDHAHANPLASRRPGRFGSLSLHGCGPYSRCLRSFARRSFVRSPERLCPRPEPDTRTSTLHASLAAVLRRPSFLSCAMPIRSAFWFAHLRSQFATSSSPWSATVNSVRQNA